MWILLVDIFMAGPCGPQPNPFYIGIVMFLIGWFIVARQARTEQMKSGVGVRST